MKAFLSAFLLLALLSTATCLKCILCLDDEETCEDTKTQECKPEEDTCASGITEILLGETKTTASFKACFQSKDCHPGYSSTTFGNNTYSRGNISCCKTDLCNSGDVQLPPRNATLNGLRCPSCFSNKSDHCHPKETVGCTHHENRCLAFAHTVTAGDYRQTSALQGCTTETVCATQVGVIKVADGLYTDNITQVECYPPSAKTWQIID